MSTFFFYLVLARMPSAEIHYWSLSVSNCAHWKAASGIQTQRRGEGVLWTGTLQTWSPDLSLKRDLSIKLRAQYCAFFCKDLVLYNAPPSHIAEWTTAMTIIPERVFCWSPVSVQSLMRFICNTAKEAGQAESLSRAKVSLYAVLMCELLSSTKVLASSRSQPTVKWPIDPPGVVRGDVNYWDRTTIQLLCLIGNLQKLLLELCS